jgi:hypothetical protein
MFTTPLRIRIFLLIGAFGLAVHACPGQAASMPETSQDHSCSFHAGGSFIPQAGKDGQNFKSGGGFQVGFGAGWHFWKRSEKRPDFLVMLDYLYGRAEAKSNPVTPPSGTTASTRGNFEAFTVGPLFRYYGPARFNFYGGMSFGWFRRNIYEHANSTQTLTNLGAATLVNSTTSSGALDFRGGANFGLTHRGGLMLFAEARAYKALAINHNTTLIPISAGIRW